MDTGHARGGVQYSSVQYALLAIAARRSHMARGGGTGELSSSFPFGAMTCHALSEVGPSGSPMPHFHFHFHPMDEINDWRSNDSSDNRGEELG